jgi:hypothetical protein
MKVVMVTKENGKYILWLTFNGTVWKKHNMYADKFACEHQREKYIANGYLDFDTDETRLLIQ